MNRWWWAWRICLGLLLGVFLSGHSLALPLHAPVPGGVAVLRLSPLTGQAPLAFWGEHPLAVLADHGFYYALLGIPLDSEASEAGALEVRVEEGGKVRTLSVSIQPKTYPAQHLRLRDQAYVAPPAELQARIARELAHNEALHQSFSSAPPPTDFQAPTQGRLSSRFGLRRYFNSEARRPHAGLDFAVPAGTPVRAAAAGRVLDVDDYFFNGRTVLVDHGQGLLTAYMHLARSQVAVGQSVQAGEILGASGASGRVTGPHLHWAVFLNGVAVDPQLFWRAGKAR